MEAVDFADLPGLVGTEVGVSDWLQVTQERVNLFADATGDHQWIHVDVERATREIGGPIAHGYLTLSLLDNPNAVEATAHVTQQGAPTPGLMSAADAAYSR